MLIGYLLLTAYGCTGGGGGGSSAGSGSGGLAGAAINVSDPSLPEDKSSSNEEGGLAIQSEGPSDNNEGPSDNTDNSGGQNTNNGVTIAKIHNPEPASMFLLGGGLAAMRCFKKKRKIQ